MEVKVPKRTCMFVGAQRSGKTFALLSMIAHSTKSGRVLVLGGTHQFIDMRNGILEHGGNPTNMLFVPIILNDVQKFMLHCKSKLSEFIAVAIMVDVVRIDRETVDFRWDKPSDDIVKLLEKLREPTAYTPKVFLGALEQGFEDEIAVG